METSVFAVCTMLLEKVREKSPEVQEYEIQDEDRKLYQQQVDELYSLIEEMISNHTIVTSVETLDIDYDYREDDAIEDTDEESQDTDSQKSSQGWEILEIGNTKYSIDVMRNVISFYDNCVKNKLEQTRRRYRFVTNYSHIKRFREYVEKNGRKSDKLKEIEDHVWQKTVDARDSLACLSEHDLRRWAIQKSRSVGLSDFRASDCWLHNLKQRPGRKIVSRKITKLTTKKEQFNESQLKENGRIFVNDVKALCGNIASKNIWNFDQSGFNYEHSNKRTLSHKGEKETVVMVKSMNAVSHSYSVMPLISMDGMLGSKMLLCLQETGGDFGSRVKGSLKVPNNIYLVSSKSGKLDKSIMRNWLTDYVDKMSPNEKMVLIHDAWSGQTDDQLYSIMENLHAHYKIPPHTTQWRQPLDKTFFRQYKIVRRKIFDRVLLEDEPIDLHKRENVIVMHSLIYNQFQSPRFVPMLKYSWYACGYIDQRPGYFLNANEILFEVNDKECDHIECERECFIKCSHCDTYLCIKHFFSDFHYHDVE